VHKFVLEQVARRRGDVPLIGLGLKQRCSLMITLMRDKQVESPSNTRDDSEIEGKRKHTREELRTLDCKPSQA